MIAETVAGTIGGGILGAGIKLLAGLLSMWMQSRKDDRNERLALADKQIELKKLGPDPNSEFVSFTRRILAFSMCFTFCAVVLLWAAFPNVTLTTPGGATGFHLNLLIFNFQRETSVVHTISTGSIVWSMLPFISMILMTYFTPNLTAK